MGETPGVNGAAIGRLHQQIQGLIDADLILPEDGQWLMATLAQVSRPPASADLPAFRSHLQGFIERLNSLIHTGIIEAATGQPPVEMASVILASLHG
jgi:hypothetical protein